ncbi:MAG: glycoside hydrolase family 18 protein [Myxococcales bacterium]|nr:glycoside hydrolase family 18 protein [Myxococcales bacterium]
MHPGGWLVWWVIGGSGGCLSGALVDPNGEASGVPSHGYEGYHDDAHRDLQSRLIGYFTSWSVYERDFEVSDIDASRLTHLHYAHLSIENDRCALADPWADVERPDPDDPAVFGSFGQLQRLKARYPHLSVLLSVGGRAGSGRFSEIASDPVRRATFADSCVGLVRQYGFDGLEVSWQFPVEGGLLTNVRDAEDGSNYTLLLAALRAAFDGAEKVDGADYLLTIASTGVADHVQHLELDALDDVVDWVNVLSLDYYGPWSDTTGHQSPLLRSLHDSSPQGAVSNVDVVRRAYVDGGLSAHKIVVGVPFHGRAWTGVGATSDGRYQPFRAVPVGTWGEAGVLDYADIVDGLEAPDNTHWDPQSASSYLFDAQDEMFVTYETPRSLAVKARYVRYYGLGGVAVWELSADTDASTLLDVVAATLERSGE